MNELPALEDLSDGDWPYVFAYGSPDLVEGATCSDASFNASNVVEVIGATPGENDGASWEIAGRLDDGRWFYLAAWCDYTGWGCQEGGSSWVANDRDSLIQFGIPADTRDVWGLS